MRYRTFGKTGWEVSEVSLGGASLMGSDPDRAEDNASEVVRKALELGINYIDTAPLYGNSEVLLGHALEGISDSFHIATKVGFDPEDFDYKKDSVLWSLERSITRLRIERISVAQIHEVNEGGWERITEPCGTLEGLLEAQKRGMCEKIGITGRAIPLLTRLVETGEFDSVLFYYDYHPCCQLAAEELIPAASELSMGIVAATVLAGGLFGHEEKRQEALDRLAEDARSKAERVLRRLHQEDGTLAQSAFRYVLADSRMSTIASGAGTIDELADVAQASEMGPLARDVIEGIHQSQK